jgi:2-polyprenyl-6-methoxyphenol hydroxylase-like FAD-dependent oxidoreductase
MLSYGYDLIVIGGGVGGSALAAGMAAAGARTLVLEAEESFRDRVRGEAVMPWGVAEARLLGLDCVLEQAGANPLPFWDSYQGADRSGRRDLTRTTRVKEPVMACYHPVLQTSLLEYAEESGAEVWRGARVTGLSVATESSGPAVHGGPGGVELNLSCRMVVGADGRGSPTRTWAGFQVRQDPERNLVSGVLMDRVALPDDATHAWLDTVKGHFILNFPQGEGRARVYLCYAAGSAKRYSGAADIQAVLKQCIASGVPAEVYENAIPAGPLATFDGRTTYTETAYKDGVALVGDAAANTDPTWGQGLSMALRDARVLKELLLTHEDWDEAGKAYSEARKQHFGVVHAMENWQTQLLMDTGPEADALRSQAMRSWREDRTRNPDTFLSGPGEPLDESDRHRFFGED